MQPQTQLAKKRTPRIGRGKLRDIQQTLIHNKQRQLRGFSIIRLHDNLKRIIGFEFIGCSQCEIEPRIRINHAQRHNPIHPQRAIIGRLSMRLNNGYRHVRIRRHVCCNGNLDLRGIPRARSMPPRMHHISTVRYRHQHRRRLGHGKRHHSFFIWRVIFAVCLENQCAGISTTCGQTAPGIRANKKRRLMPIRIRHLNQILSFFLRHKRNRHRAITRNNRCLENLLRAKIPLKTQAKLIPRIVFPPPVILIVKNAIHQRASRRGLPIGRHRHNGHFKRGIDTRKTIIQVWLSQPHINFKRIDVYHARCAIGSPPFFEHASAQYRRQARRRFAQRRNLPRHSGLALLIQSARKNIGSNRLELNRLIDKRKTLIPGKYRRRTVQRNIDTGF